MRLHPPQRGGIDRRALCHGRADHRADGACGSDERPAGTGRHRRPLSGALRPRAASTRHPCDSVDRRVDILDGVENARLESGARVRYGVTLAMTAMVLTQLVHGPSDVEIRELCTGAEDRPARVVWGFAVSLERSPPDRPSAVSRGLPCAGPPARGRPTGNGPRSPPAAPSGARRVEAARRHRRLHGPVLQTIGDAFDECCAISGARSRERLETASWTASTSLPSVCSTAIPPATPFCASVSAADCRGARRRYGPLIVGDDEHHRKGPGAGDVDRRVHIALGGRTVAKRKRLRRLPRGT